MRAWWELYKKDLFTLGFFMLVVILLVFAWEFFLFYKIDAWPGGLTFSLSFLPFSFFPLLLLWLGYNGFRAEWKDDTNYFLLSLPRHGWEISLAKLAAAMTFYLVVPLVTALLIYIFQWGPFKNMMEIPEFILEGQWAIKTIFKIFVFYWLSGLALYIITQFSQLVSLFYDRFRGLVTIVVFIISNYLVYRGGSILAPLLKWLPDFPVEVINETRMGLQKTVIYLGSGPVIGSAVLLGGVFLLGSWLLENQLEV
ncbi:MAG: hypothetical protein ACOCQN_04610 [Halanaerobiaceae bacterium]